MRCIWLLAFVGWSAQAQVLVDPSRVPENLRDMHAEDSTGPLKCNVMPFKPSLNYSFRFQTGYVLAVPLDQYTGKGHSIATLLRVTPENSERDPVYLVSRMRLGEVPPTKAVLELGGGYVVGEGKYRVDMLVSDDAGRTCTKNWKITAKLGRKEDDVTPGMAAGAV